MLREKKHIKLINLSLILITFWSSFSLFFPLIFEGIGVYIPNEGIDNIPQSLHFSTSNIAQLMYLIENLIFIRFFITKNSMTVQKFKVLLLFSGSIIALIGFWRISGLIYPENLLNNGLKSGVQQFSEIGFSRLASTLPEPSYAGAFLAPLLALSIFSFLKFKESIYIFTTTLFSAALLMTFSSVGFIATGMFVPILILVFGKKLFLANEKLENKIVLLLISIIFLALVSLLLSNDLIISIIDNVIYGKLDSSSSVNRSSSDLYSLELFLKTYGLGVGIGSNRPSSFLAWLASNLGFPGILFFVFCLVMPLLGYSANRKMNLFFLPYFINLLCMMVAIPDLAWPYLWIYMALSSISPID